MPPQQALCYTSILLPNKIPHFQAIREIFLKMTDANRILFQQAVEI